MHWMLSLSVLEIGSSPLTTPPQTPCRKFMMPSWLPAATKMQVKCYAKVFIYWNIRKRRMPRESERCEELQTRVGLISPQVLTTILLTRTSMTS